MHLPLGLPFHLSSLLPFLNDITKKGKKKQQKQVTKRKTSTFGKKDGGINDTTTLSHHPCILCHFANYMHTTNSLHAYLAYSYALNEQGTQLCSVHSLAHKRRSISTMFSSNESSQHNLNSNISYRPAIAHTLHSFSIQSRQTISAMLSIATT